ncbi:hypothetical protein CLCR_00736 [Cladophialophora carrionii]|uniref:Uncharacterized protein n=1 Tax=Cladophialophora carrionii TaxID=86049 RepID=A0A1C1C6T7_9EURO|nr:hypothetical protein CLCR_00736 [Cladophialophora carrionii]
MILARTAENQSPIRRKDNGPKRRDEEAGGHLQYLVLAHTNQKAADTTQLQFQKAPARSGTQDNNTTEDDETTKPIVLNITDIRAARVSLGGTAREVIMGEMEAVGGVVETAVAE